MAPQFFKDVSHSGLNGKFMSRTISLKMDHNDNDNARDTSNDSIEDDNSANSANILHNSSVSSTGSVSKFFVSAAGVGGKSTHISKDYMFNDSSLDDIILQSAKAKKESDDLDLEDDEDDDLQIMDVREVPQETSLPTPSDESNDILRNTINPTPEFESDNSSGDVMLDALYKSQKYSVFLKKKLEAVNAKAANQEVEISNHQKKTEQLKEIFGNFKEKLSKLEQDSSELKTSRNFDNEKLEALKIEYRSMSELLSSYKIEIVGLKKHIDHLKQLKVSTTFEIEKRSKDIETLQKRLDEKSGLLSEQKIRTQSLEKSLESCRLKYDESIKGIMSSSVDFQDKLVKKLEDSCAKLEDFNNALFKNSLTPLITESNVNISNNIEDLGKLFTKSLDLSKESVFEQIKESNSETTQGMLKVIDDKSKINLKSLKTLSDNQKKVEQNFNKITDLINKINSNIINTNLSGDDFKKFLQNIEVRIEDLDKGIKNQDGLTLKIESLSKEKQKLQEAQSKNLEKIQELEIIIEENSKVIQTHDNNTKTLEATCQAYQKEIDEFRSKITLMESNLNMSEDKLLKCKSNCESKMKTQLEIHGFVVQERDEIKTELTKQKMDLNDLIEIQSTQIKNLRKENERLTLELEKSKTEHTKIMDLKKENSDLRQEIKELKAKPAILSSKKSHSLSDDLEQNTSMIDVISIKALDPKISKSTANQNKDFAGMSKKKSKIQVPKRKKLLDEDDVSLFDDFDFDSIIDSQIPSIPRRYTKKKKT